MSNTTALRSYSRVIPAKYAGKACYACAAPIVVGRDFAAVTPGGRWDNFCAACASSYAAQVAGLIKLAEAAAAAHPNAVIGVTIPDDAFLTRVIKGDATDADGYEATQQLQRFLAEVTSRAVESSDPRIPVLRKVAADPQAGAWERRFSADMVDRLVAGRGLSDKQAACIDRIVKAASAPAGTAKGYEPGIYTDNGGRIVKVQKSRQSGRTYGKVWTGRGFDYQAGILRDSSLRPLTADEAAAFGHQYGTCVNCGRTLTDDGPGRSVQVGYGPVCAERNGWPWG